MELETSLAEGIDLTDDKARYDAACKRLLSEKILLAWIMKSCMQEYQDYSVQEIAANYIEGTPEISTVAVHPDQTNFPRIHGVNTEDKTLTEGTVFYDIRFIAIAPVSGEYIRLIINLEAQNTENLTYDLIIRGVYYGARMISAQHGTEFTKSEYQEGVFHLALC